MKTKIFTVLLILSMATSVNAQRTAKTATTVANFLKIGTDARTIGMGQAAVADASDLSALHWNVAGLARYHIQGVTFTQSKWLADTNLLHFGGTLDFGKFGVAGISVTTLDYGNMAVRTEQDPNGTGDHFTAADLSLGLVYANNLTDRFSIGGQFKVIREEIWHMTASTAAIDLGVLYFAANKKLSLGMSISNFGGKMQLAGRDVRFYSDPSPTMYGNNDQIPAEYELEHWPLPLTFRVGIASDIYDRNHLKVKVLADALHPSDNSEYINIGGEVSFFNQFFIRGGMRSLFMVDQEGGLSLGAGLKYAFSPRLKFKVDYGWSDYNRLTYINMLSVSLMY